MDLGHSAPILEGLAGLLVVLATLFDVFLVVIVPRRAPTLGRRLRISARLIPRLWTVWRELGLRSSSAERRELFLGMYGSLAVVLLLVAWVAGLVVGYGCSWTRSGRSCDRRLMTSAPRCTSPACPC